jgi:hypothetical protein
VKQASKVKKSFKMKDLLVGMKALYEIEALPAAPLRPTSGPAAARGQK